jgi:hypothetical protein
MKRYLKLVGGCSLTLLLGSCLLDHLPAQELCLGAISPTLPCPPEDSSTVAGLLSGPDSEQIVEQFATGCAKDCNSLFTQLSVGLRAPRSWFLWDMGRAGRDPRRLLDPKLNGVDPLCNDTTSCFGLERADIVFFAGHGSPSEFAVVSKFDVNVNQMSLGDQRTKYVFLVSCNVLAHGSKVPAENNDFTRPWLFSAGSSSENVFQNLATIKNSRSPVSFGLRLFCGGSSDIGGGDFPIADFLLFHKALGLPIADSFLLGLNRSKFEVPLCMTRGPAKPEESTLYDLEFASLLNPANSLPSSDRFVYIEYPIRQELTSSSLAGVGLESLPATSPEPLPRVMPALLAQGLRMLPVSNPSNTKMLSYGFRGGPVTLVFSEGSPAARLLQSLRLYDKSLRVSQHQLSGALTIQYIQDDESVSAAATSDFSWFGSQIKGDSGLAEKAAIPNLLQFLSPLVTNLSVTNPTQTQLRVDRVAEAALTSPSTIVPSCLQSCVVFRLPLAVPVTNDNPSLTNHTVPIAGAEVMFRLCPGSTSGFTQGCTVVDRRDFTASFFFPEVTGTTEGIKLRDIDRIREEAVSTLGARKDEYEETGTPSWAYRNPPANCLQDKLLLYVTFTFRPRSEDSELPPREISVLAFDAEDLEEKAGPIKLNCIGEDGELSSSPAPW